VWLCHLAGVALVAVHHVNEGGVFGVACSKYSNTVVYVVCPQPPQPLPLSLLSTAKILSITKVELCFVASVNNPVSEEDTKDPLIYYIIEPRWGWGAGRPYWHVISLLCDQHTVWRLLTLCCRSF